MKKMSAVAAMLAVGLGMTATLAQARDDHDGHRGQGKGHYKHDDRRGNKHDDQRDWAREQRRDDRDHDRRHGAGPDHRWVKGYRVPPQYRGPQYVVKDWRGHRLSAPPRGYHWVQYGGDYMLVAIASGVIAQLILSGY